MGSKLAAMEFIAQQTGDVFVRANARGVVRYVSNSVRALGYEPSEIVGTTGLQLVHPDDRATFIANTEAALRGERQTPRARVHRFRTADNQWRWMEGNPRLIRNRRGQVIELVNVLRDVTDRREAEAAADDQAELMSSAFEHTGIGKALVGLDGAFLSINSAFCDIVGYPQAVMLKLDFQTITHPDDLDIDLDLLAQLTRGEIPNYRMDKRYRRADGSVVWVHLTVSMVRDATGAPKLYVAQVQDQTQQRAAEAALQASEARFRLLAENASDLIMQSNTDGRLAYISPSCLAVTGYRPEEMIGHSALRWIHPEDRALVVEAFQAQVAQGEASSGEPIEYRLEARDGRTIWMESLPRANVDPATGEVTSVTDVAREVTIRKALEASLAEARDAAEAAASVKADFMANMSHEIRTPLTAILGFTSLLGARGEISADARYQVERIASAGHALLTIVNDILDFSKLEAGLMPIKPRPTGLREALAESLALFEPQAAAKSIALTLVGAATLPHAEVDPDRLRQVLLNLVGNAVKFTDAGAVVVRAVYHRKAAKLRLEVQDSGPGMDARQQAMLFQRFSQVDASSTRRHGGTGLGLAICRGLVEAMGGEIGVRSEVGRGSTFWFTVSAPRAKQAVGPAAVQGISLSGVRVLIADDNPVNRELVRALLAPLDAEIVEAVDGVEAVEVAQAQPFDVILLDIRMPRRDGPDAVLQIRNQPGPNQSIPILAFTADYDLERYGEQAVRGFDGVVRKPIIGAELIAEIARAVTVEFLAPQTETEVAA
ncbi:PAS domain S-box protein [Phenylobacterium sp.]|uniref:PAS domain-containing hybrid sensor histidine kinase/response regulator n=1 Tax=Phenylobacterium sp. TaxID=1871053 RepID=UPI0039834964